METRRRHLIHMATEVDLEVNSMEVLPAGPRRPRGEPLLSQLSVADTIQACRWTKQTHTHTEGCYTRVAASQQFSF